MARLSNSLPTPQPADALAQLHDLDDANPELSILKLSEPIASSADIIIGKNSNSNLNPTASSQSSPLKRASDVSVSTNDALENPSPASLEADLTHYKELFSKLRFSYLEQVTKEKFLRAIVGDPPLVVGHNDNLELEAQLARGKEELRASKRDVAQMTEDMEKMGRELAGRYKAVQLQTTQLSELPASIAELESAIDKLRASAHVPGLRTNSESGASVSSSSQTLALPETLRVLAEREAELASLNRQLSSVETALPRKSREAEAVEREVVGLERKRNEVVAHAREAERRKQEGESDGLEEMGRWYKGVEQGLKGLV